MINHIGKSVRKYLPRLGAERLKTYLAWTKTSLPVSRKAALTGGLEVRLCRNCDTALTGDFCPRCGQLDRDLGRPIWALLVDSADALFDLDSRIFRTLMPLVFMPGHLTRSYNQGKRARYLPPVRLYIISSLIFFLTVSFADVAIVKIEFLPQAPDTGISTAGFGVNTAEIGGEPGESGQTQGSDQGADHDRAATGSMATEDDARENISGGDNPVEAAGEEAQAVAAADQIGRPDITGEAAQTDRSQDRPGSGGSVIAIGDEEFDIEIQMFAPAEPSEGAMPLPADTFDKAVEELGEARKEALADLGGFETRMKLASLDFFEDALKGFQVALQDPRALNKELNIWLPRAMIIMLPVFALLLRMFYWGRDQYLMNMLVFSLHFHSYIFLVITFFILAQILIGSAASAGLFVLAVPVYLFIGLKVMTGQGVIRTFFKFIFLSFIYSFMMNAVLIAIFLVGLSEI